MNVSFLPGFLLVGLIVLGGLVFVALGQASSGSGYRVVCYNFSGVTVFDAVASEYRTGPSGVRIKLANGKVVETIFATCVATEQ